MSNPRILFKIQIFHIRIDLPLARVPSRESQRRCRCRPEILPNNCRAGYHPPGEKKGLGSDLLTEKRPVSAFLQSHSHPHLTIPLLTVPPEQWAERNGFVWSVPVTRLTVSVWPAHVVTVRCSDLQIKKTPLATSKKQGGYVIHLLYPVRFISLL